MNDHLRWAVDRAPIGVWTTVLGTADIVMQDTLCLASDGTGYLESRSVLRGAERLAVAWKHVRPGTLQMAILYPEDNPNDEPLWETILYRDAVVQIDAGGAHVPVLRNVNGTDFWNLAGPIGFVSPAPSAAR